MEYERIVVARRVIGICTEGISPCGPYNFEEFIEHLMENSYDRYNEDEARQALNEMLHSNMIRREGIWTRIN